jgi:hypothetical protein
MQMEDRHEEQTEETKLVSELRKAIEHRATWMYNLLKEARERGLDWDDVGRKAVRDTGHFHGELRKDKMEDPTSLHEFSTVFAAGTSRDVFEMEVVEADEEKYYLDFHYCPLVNAWEKQGASVEDIEHLCEISMEGDRGMADQFPEFEFTLGKTIAQGHPVCQIRFDKKDPESE